MQKTVTVPLFNPAYRNVFGVELSDETEILRDGYLDEKGFTKARPGLASFLDLDVGDNNPVTGLFWWPHKQYVIAVSDGRIFKVEYNSSVATYTDLTGDALTSGLPASFATDGTYVFIAADGKIVYTNGTATTAYIADGDTPIAVSHVAYLDGYLLCNKLDSNSFYWSDVNSSLAWTATNFASAAGNADYVTALKVLNREIFLFGPSTLEIWENDGETPFARVPGGFLEAGCIAPQSVVINENTIFWLNDKRHFVQFSNGSYERISTPYDKDISSYGTVADCQGKRIEIDGRPFLLFGFPTEEKTLCYDMALKSWSEWNTWDKTNMAYKMWGGESYCYAPAWGKHLVGLKNDSVVCVLDINTYTDLGSEIRCLKRTGHIDFGTSKLKRENELRIRVKRGANDAGANGATNPRLMFRWRDNGETEWSKEKYIDLGAQGNREIITRLHRTGIYRTRQYEFVATDGVPIVYGSAEADIEVLR